MKILFVIAFFELCVVGVFAQSSRVTLDVFQIDKKVIKDGKLVYFNSEGDTTIHFMFGLSKNVELL